MSSKSKAPAKPSVVKSKSLTSKTGDNSLGFGAKFALVFLVLLGVTAAGSILYPEIAAHFPGNCFSSDANDMKFLCIYGPFEAANLVGGLLFVAFGYWFFCKWLRIASLWQIILGAAVTVVLSFLFDHYFYQLTQNLNGLPHGLAFHLQWSRGILATLAGAATVVLFSKSKSK